MGKIFTVAIQKGGTGKTTTAAAIAQAGAHYGRRVLAIDLDPQGNCSYMLAARPDNVANSYNLLTGQELAENTVIRSAQGLDVIPASWDLSTITSGKGSARRLQEALAPIKKKYDLIIIDTPPTAGELQYNALQAADGLIIPLMADAFNIQSLYQITDTARQIRATNRRLKITGIVLTQYDGRSTLAKQMQEALIEQARALKIPYLGTIRAGVAIKEAAALQQSLFEYAPKSKPAADYVELYKQITQEV